MVIGVLLVGSCKEQLGDLNASNVSPPHHQYSKLPMPAGIAKIPAPWPRASIPPNLTGRRTCSDDTAIHLLYKYLIIIYLNLFFF